MRGRLRIGVILGLGLVTARGVLALYYLLLIHRMAPGDYGDFAYAMSILGVLVMVSDGGFSRLLLRDVARAGADRGRRVWTLLAVRTAWVGAITLIVGIASVAGAFSFSDAFVAWMLAYMTLEAGGAGFDAAGQAADRPCLVSGAQLASAVSLAAWGVVLLVWKLTPSLALAGLAGASAVRLLAQVPGWLRERPAQRWWPGLARARGLLKEALPLLILASLTVLYYRLDVIILHLRRGSVETASYAAAYRVLDAAVTLAGVAFTAIAPHMSRVLADHEQAVWREWCRYLLAVGLLAVPGTIAIAAAAEPLAGVLFGHRYGRSAGENLVLLSPGIAFMAMQIVNASVVLMSSDRRAVVRLTLFNLAFNLVVTWFLVGADGAHGASIATSVAEAVTFVGFAVLVRRRHRSSPSPHG